MIFLGRSFIIFQKDATPRGWAGHPIIQSTHPRGANGPTHICDSFFGQTRLVCRTTPTLFLLEPTGTDEFNCQYWDTFSHFVYVICPRRVRVSTRIQRHDFKKTLPCTRPEVRGQSQSQTRGVCLFERLRRTPVPNTNRDVVVAGDENVFVFFTSRVALVLGHRSRSTAPGNRMRILTKL